MQTYCSERVAFHVEELQAVLQTVDGHRQVLEQIVAQVEALESLKRGDVRVDGRHLVPLQVPGPLLDCPPKRSKYEISDEDGKGGKEGRTGCGWQAESRPPEGTP